MFSITGRNKQALANDREAHSSIENYGTGSSAYPDTNPAPKNQMTNVQFNIIRSQKYQDRKAIVIENARTTNMNTNIMDASSQGSGKYPASGQMRSKIVNIRPLKDSDYYSGGQQKNSHSIDRALTGKTTNLSNFRKT